MGKNNRATEMERANAKNDRAENTLWHVLRTLLFRIVCECVCVCKSEFFSLIILLLPLLHSYNSSVNVLWEYTTAARFRALFNSLLYSAVSWALFNFAILPCFLLTPYFVQYFFFHYYCCWRCCFLCLLSLQCVAFAFIYNICPSIIFNSLIILLSFFHFVSFCSILFTYREVHSLDSLAFHFVEYKTAQHCQRDAILRKQRKNNEPTTNDFYVLFICSLCFIAYLKVGWGAHQMYYEFLYACCCCYCRRQCFLCCSSCQKFCICCHTCSSRVCFVRALII